QVIETRIHKTSEFSTYFFHTLIKQRPGSIVDLFAMEGSGKLKKGETARVCGLPIGRAEVTNAVGGKFTHLTLVSFIP
ncbi:hypothetical protein QT995_12965, partial [Microcoleus sp. S36b_A3]